MPIITAAKRRCQFPWRRDIGIAVQNMTNLVRILLMHTLQRQLCESFGSMSIKSSTGRIRLRAFRNSSVFSGNTEAGRCYKGAEEAPQTRRKRSEAHRRNNDATVSLRKLIPRMGRAGSALPLGTCGTMRSSCPRTTVQAGSRLESRGVASDEIISRRCGGDGFTQFLDHSCNQLALAGIGVRFSFKILSQR